MMMPVNNLADMNIIPALNSLLRPIQQMDTLGEWGRRSIKLSADPRLLSGFSLNKKNSFDSIVRTPVEHGIDRNLLKASVDIPALLPGINFFVPWTYPLFSFQITLGIVPDLEYNALKNKYESIINYDHFSPVTVNTDWFPLSQGSPAISLDLNYPNVPPDQSNIMLLSIGIRYGAPGASNQIDQIKYAGAAKVLSAV